MKAVEWYLMYCDRESLRIGKLESVRSFMERVKVKGVVPAEEIQHWKAGLNEFFRMLRNKLSQSGAGAISVESTKSKIAVQKIQPKTVAEWEMLAIRGIRLRNFSYRTEQTYMGWLRRFQRFAGTNGLEQLGQDEIKMYLNHLAVKERVAIGTQRQALNALVFLYLTFIYGMSRNYSDIRILNPDYALETNG